MTFSGDHPKYPFILSGLWLLAFVCSLYPVNAWQMEFFGGCVLTLLLWSYLMFSKRIFGAGHGLEGRASISSRAPVLIAAGAFWLLVVASVFWSEVKPISLIGVCFFSVMPLSFFGGIAGGSARYFKIIAYGLAAIFAVLSVWAVLQFFFLNSYFLGQARHPLADPGSLGGLFSLALFCAMGWMLVAKKKKESVLAVSLAALLICGIMSTVARGPIFAFAPGLVFFLVLGWPFVRRRWRGFAALILIACLFYGLMQTGAQKKYDLAARVLETAVHTPGNPDGTSNRMTVWATTIDMIKDAPWLGSGIGTFYLRYPQFQKPTDADGAFLAHNDPLQFWTELGVLGPLLFYAFVLLAAIRTFKALSSLKRADACLGDEAQGWHGALRVGIVSIFSGLVAMVAQSHVNFNLYNLSILMLSGFLLSVWYFMTVSALQEQAPVTEVRRQPAFSRLLLAVPFVMTGWLIGSIVTGEHYANRARDELFAENMFKFADSVNSADRVSQGLNFRTFLFAVNVPMSILQLDKETKKAFDKERQEKLYAQVKDYMDKVIALNPLEPAPYYYLARVQGLVDPSIIPEGTPSPEDYYKKALTLDPVYLQARLALDDLYQVQKKTVYDRLAILSPGENFSYTTPIAPDFYNRLAQAYLETKQYEKTKDVMRLMVNFQKLDLYSRQRQASSIPQALLGGDKAIAKP